MTKNKIVPIVYALDDNFIPFMCVSIDSLLMNSSKDAFYKFYVLNRGVSKKVIDELQNYNTENSSITFIDVNDLLSKLDNKICVRDNYSAEIYFRFFIPDLLFEYDKVIYLDSDTVINGDICDLFNTDISNYFVGAIKDQAVASNSLFIEYVEKYLQIDSSNYFNSGVLLINAKKFREEKIYDQFVRALDVVTFRVAPDQDYLNLILKDRVLYLSDGWNQMPIKETYNQNNKLNLIHFNLNLKPWKYDDVLFEEYFWKYAKNSLYYGKILQIKHSFSSVEDEKMQANFENLIGHLKDCLQKKPSTIFSVEKFYSDIRIQKESVV